MEPLGHVNITKSEGGGGVTVFSNLFFIYNAPTSCCRKIHKPPFENFVSYTMIIFFFSI